MQLLSRTVCTSTVLTTICACSLMRCWINPAVNDLTFTKFQKNSFTWSSCQVYGLLLSNQSEPSNVHKNWILWHLPLKNNICTPAVNHRWCLVILTCASVRYSSCSTANRNWRHINCDKRQCGFRLSCESRVLLCPLSVKSKNTQSRDVVCMWRKETMKTDAAQGKIKYVACLLSHCLIF